MSDNLQQLEEVAGSGITIALNGELCGLVPLSPGDLAKAACNLRKLRMDRYVQETRSVPWDDNVRAKTIAELSSQAVTIFDVIDDREAAMFLIYLSLNKADKVLNYSQVVTMLDPVDNEDWLPTLFKISKINVSLPGAASGDEDPLPDTTSSP